MSIIISKDGKNAQKLDRTVIAQEQYLQNYIHHNPESLPLYEISQDLRLLILTREFPTSSGPIDAIGIDQFGNIYVIETKLYKNPDKKLVSPRCWTTGRPFGVPMKAANSQGGWRPL